MIVVKFGGSSLAGAERMLAAARIVAGHRQGEAIVCVVSAMKGVTDRLLTIAHLASRNSSAWRPLYADLHDWHEQTLAALTTSESIAQHPALAPSWAALEADAAALAMFGDGCARDEAIAVFSAWGERLSVRLFAAALARVGVEASCFEDAPVIVEHAEHGSATGSSRWSASISATCAWLRDPVANLHKLRLTPVLPGYLALTQNGQYATLGRNGSDHSAAVIAAALNASAVYLYSDVAGVYQADPRIVPRAKLLARLSYDEATAIAATGARVLHPATIPPLAQHGIPLHLRSALDPAAPGTDIGPADPECTRLGSAQTPAMAPFLPTLVAPGCGAKGGRLDAY